MKSILLPLLGVLLSLSDHAKCRQYHYDKPSTPFVTGSATASVPTYAVQPANSPQPIATYYVVKSHNGKQYEIHTSNSKRVYEGLQHGVPRYANNYHNALGSNGGGNGAAASRNVNPLLQPPPYVAPPSYGVPPSQNRQTITYVIQSVPAAAPATPPQQYRINTNAGTSANAGASSFAYNNGQGTFGAQSSYGVGAAQRGEAVLSGQINPFTAQSPVGQLDQVPFKQGSPGDTRAFTRVVTTCHPDGRCEKITLGPGQQDPLNEQVLAEARARISPVSEKCKRIAAQAQANAISSGSDVLSNSIGNNFKTYPESTYKRPKDRRLYPYSESVLPMDPYN